MGDSQVNPEEKQLFCPQCKTWMPASCYNSIPLDLRCNKCIPLEASMAIHDQKVALAGQKVAQVIAKYGNGKTLEPLARIVDGFYDEYGGVEPLCKDLSQWVKDLAATGKKSQALSFVAKLMSIHAKVEHNQVEENWNNLTKAEIEARLALKMAAIMAKMENPEAKKDAIRYIAGGQSLE